MASERRSPACELRYARIALLRHVHYISVSSQPLLVFSNHAHHGIPRCVAGVWCDGSAYGVGDAEGLIFSVPVISHRGGRVEVVSDLTIDPFVRRKLQETEDELRMERGLAFAPAASL